jgi:hypothetical protein
MNKTISWLGAGTMAVTLWACGGKVVVDGIGDNSGGAGSLGTGGSTSSGTIPLGCGNLVMPSPGELTPCTGGVGAGSGGMTTCERDVCDANGNILGAVCSGAACACQVNGITKCGCTTTGVTDFCSATPCCPWFPIPL